MNMLIAGEDDLSTVMHVLLIRFGIVALGVAALAVLVFALAVRMKKAGRQDQLRRYGETAVGLWQSRRDGAAGGRGRRR